MIHYPGRLDVIIPPPGFKGWPLIYLCLSIAGNIFCAVYVLGPIFVAINRSDIAQLATLFFSVPLTCLAIFHLRRAIEGCYEQQRLVLRADKYRLGPEVTLHRNRPDFMDSQAVNKKVGSVTGMAQCMHVCSPHTSRSRCFLHYRSSHMNYAW